ncbi:MAG: DUF5801 repeats-in-toxin domain-containing protein, partial [Cyanobium sp.]
MADELTTLDQSVLEGDEASKQVVQTAEGTGYQVPGSGPVVEGSTQPGAGTDNTITEKAPESQPPAVDVTAGVNGPETYDTGSSGGVALQSTQPTAPTDSTAPQLEVLTNPIEQTLADIPPAIPEQPPENGVPTIDLGAVADGELELYTDDTGLVTADGSNVASVSFAQAVANAVGFNFGPDGPGISSIGGWALSLAVVGGTQASVLDEAGNPLPLLTTSGDPVYLWNVGGVIVGSTSISAPGSPTDPAVVFTLQVNGEGLVTLTQIQPIEHYDPNNENELLQLADGQVLLTAVATISDADGDSASSEVVIDLGGNVGFYDDALTAQNDFDSVASGSYVPATGNVITGLGTTSTPAGIDTVGADGATITSILG